MLTMKNLELCFESAKEQGYLYVGIKIKMEGFEEAEVIINPIANFDKKLEYYKNAYNNDLTLKSFNGIKIIGFSYGDTYDEIEMDLVLE